MSGCPNRRLSEQSLQLWHNLPSLQPILYEKEEEEEDQE